MQLAGARAVHLYSPPTRLHTPPKRCELVLCTAYSACQQAHRLPMAEIKHSNPTLPQLTDEVTTGDNPAEQRTRDEHEILDSDVSANHCCRCC